AFFALALVMAAAIAALRGSVSALLSVATEEDSVALLLFSAGCAFFALALAMAAAIAACFLSLSVVAVAVCPVCVFTCLAERRALRAAIISLLSGNIAPLSLVIFLVCGVTLLACF